MVSTTPSPSPSPSPNPNPNILRLGSGPWAVELDLMQPLDPGRAPKVHVPRHGQSVPLAVAELGSCASSGRAWQLP